MINNVDITSHEQDQRKGRRRESGERLPVSCQLFYALFMFPTSDFPFLVEWLVRVTETIPQALGKVQTQTEAARLPWPTGAKTLILTWCGFLLPWVF